MPHGATLEYLVSGDGQPTTAFAHGIAGGIPVTRPLGSGVSGRKVFFQFRGHGRSDPPGDTFGYADLAADLRRQRREQARAFVPIRPRAADDAAIGHHRAQPLHSLVHLHHTDLRLLFAGDAPAGVGPRFPGLSGDGRELHV